MDRMPEKIYAYLCNYFIFQLDLCGTLMNIFTKIVARN